MRGCVMSGPPGLVWLGSSSLTTFFRRHLAWRRGGGASDRRQHSSRKVLSRRRFRRSFRTPQGPERSGGRVLAVREGVPQHRSSQMCRKNERSSTGAERSGAPLGGRPQGGPRPAGHGRPANGNRRPPPPSCHLPPGHAGDRLCGSGEGRPHPADRGSPLFGVFRRSLRSAVAASTTLSTP